MSVYTDNGYEDRNHYLESLSEEYEVPLDTVRAMAYLLGPNEDFDGLVSHLQDYSLYS